MIFGSKNDFRKIRNKILTVIGMSGVGKTHMSRSLDINKWFLYSVDYMIGRMLEQEINNMIEGGIQDERIRKLTQNGIVNINNRISVYNIELVSLLLEPDDSLSDEEWSKQVIAKQQLYLDAEVIASSKMVNTVYQMFDLYGYQNCFHDTTGSICEILDTNDLENDIIFQNISENSIILYIESLSSHIDTLVDRLNTNPKPISVNPTFCKTLLQSYILSNSKNLSYYNFLRSCYKDIFLSRIAKYQKIAQHGYTISASDASSITNERELFECIESLI